MRVIPSPCASSFQSTKLFLLQPARTAGQRTTGKHQQASAAPFSSPAGRTLLHLGQDDAIIREADKLVLLADPELHAEDPAEADDVTGAWRRHLVAGSRAVRPGKRFRTRVVERRRDECTVAADRGDTGRAGLRQGARVSAYERRGREERRGGQRNWLANGEPSGKTCFV